ncbi:MAG: hypothetical protein K9L98_00005, partial [Candidatus Pacebacteria bacterium]|nr:hypothetical protein [Candidatus Paceibacterota bacterium]
LNKVELMTKEDFRLEISATENVRTKLTNEVNEIGWVRGILKPSKKKSLELKIQKLNTRLTFLINNRVTFLKEKLDILNVTSKEETTQPEKVGSNEDSKEAEEVSKEAPGADVEEPAEVEKVSEEAPGADVEEPAEVEKVSKEAPGADVEEPAEVEKVSKEAPGADVEEPAEVEKVSEEAPGADVEEPAEVGSNDNSIYLSDALFEKYKPSTEEIQTNMGAIAREVLLKKTEDKITEALGKNNFPDLLNKVELMTKEDFRLEINATENVRTKLTNELNKIGWVRGILKPSKKKSLELKIQKLNTRLTFLINNRVTFLNEKLDILNVTSKEETTQPEKVGSNEDSKEAEKVSGEALGGDIENRNKRNIELKRKVIELEESVTKGSSIIPSFVPNNIDINIEIKATEQVIKNKNAELKDAKTKKKPRKVIKKIEYQIRELVARNEVFLKKLSNN